MIVFIKTVETNGIRRSILNARENYLRAVRFERPEYIPTNFHINGACWHHYPHDALVELMAEHPMLFPDFEKTSEKVVPNYSPVQRAGKPYTDPWRCTWETTDDGITGTVTKHPLADWNDFEGFVPPDPETTNGLVPIDWDDIAERIRQDKEDGRLVARGMRHGHTFMQLCDLRGYENLMFDMVDDEPRLGRLIEMLEQFNMAVVRRYIELGAEQMGYAEDLGMQVGPMLSPEHFLKYIKPSYQRLMAPARKAGCIVHMHSDGDIRTLVNDLIDGGVEIINLQDLVNGIDWIRDKLAGKVCIDLDIDRQNITVRGTPAQIDALIREEVEKLGSKAGGLIIMHGVYPGVPLENIKATMDAMEKYSTYYS